MNSNHFPIRTTSWAILALIVVAMGVVIGCSSPKRLATLTGKVTYKGKPVSVGAIYFHGPADEMAMGNLQEDGSFTATDLPIGAVKVSLRVQDPGVYAQKLKGQGASLEKPTAKDIDKVTSLPHQYSDPNTSGLTYTLTPTTTTLDITIE
jgi:hypothetical protein